MRQMVYEGHQKMDERTMGEQIRVLIVEDDRDALAIMGTALAHEGFVVFTVQDGALACAAVVSNEPDLVLLDLRLPNASGEEIAAELHSDPRCAHIPIVIVTADVRARDAVFPPNVRWVILKPCEPREVVAGITKAL